VKRGDFDLALSKLDALRKSRLGYAGGLPRYAMELIAQIHEDSGDVDSAIEQHKEMLRIYGGHALSHFDLGRLYEQTGRSVDAKRHYERFLKMWKNADEGLPQLEHAKERIEALKGQI